MKLQETTFRGKIKGGKLEADRHLIAKCLEQYEDCEVTLTFKRVTNSRTAKMNAAFHGVVLPQIAAHIEQTAGLLVTTERIKRDLKEAFLPPRKLFYSNGEPVTRKMAHPEKKGVHYICQVEEIPSLSEISPEEYKAFLDAVIHHYLHQEGLSIEINNQDSHFNQGSHFPK